MSLIEQIEQMSAIVNKPSVITIEQRHKYIEELLNFKPAKQDAFVIFCNSNTWEIINKYLKLR